MIVDNAASHHFLLPQGVEGGEDEDGQDDREEGGEEAQDEIRVEALPPPAHDGDEDGEDELHDVAPQGERDHHHQGQQQEGGPASLGGAGESGEEPPACREDHAVAEHEGRPHTQQSQPAADHHQDGVDGVEAEPREAGLGCTEPELV